jgi:hypothetical protein
LPAAPPQARPIAGGHTAFVARCPRSGRPPRRRLAAVWCPPGVPLYSSAKRRDVWQPQRPDGDGDFHLRRLGQCPTPLIVGEDESTVSFPSAPAGSG